MMTEEFKDSILCQSEEYQYLEKAEIGKAIDALSMPDIHKDKIGNHQWDGLSERLRPVFEATVEGLDHMTTVGKHEDANILSGLDTEESSFDLVEERIEKLETILNKAATALIDIKTEIKWLKKLTTLKW